MTVKEFSDAFDTLLASYAHKAEFGDLSSLADVSLDEYEKSIFLTLAQDNIVKNYFTRSSNSIGEGFDDSTRRQVDFSSLITVKDLTRSASGANVFDERGLLFKMPRKLDSNNTPIEGTTDVLYILNEKLVALEKTTVEVKGISPYSNQTLLVLNKSNKPIHITLYFQNTETSQDLDLEVLVTSTDSLINIMMRFSLSSLGGFAQHFAYRVRQNANVTAVADILYTGFANLTLPESSWSSVKVFDSIVPVSNKKEFVIVPINYREYDREMSKPYAQPLKKQAWRLFQNQVTGFDIDTELIPKFNLTEETWNILYRIRYVRRPRPIILEDLPNGLTIDKEDEESECELNPILHMDILEEAIRLALNSKGIETRDLRAAREAASRNNRG